MLRRISILSVVICCAVIFLATGHDNVARATEWDKTHGGANDDGGQCVQQTFDGGYIIVGYTDTGGRYGVDIYLIKTDSSGDTVWTRTFARRGDDYGECVRQTPDSGYIIAGSINSGSQAYLIKTDSLGNTEWAEDYGGAYGESGESVQLTFDGGYILTGRTYSYGAGTPDKDNVYIVKTDDEGDAEWDTAYGGPWMDVGRWVDQTSDSGYIVTGLTSTCLYKCYALYLIKTDRNGSKLWEKRYVPQDSLSYQDWGEWVEETDDSGFIIAGVNSSFAASSPLAFEVWLIKTDEDGDTSWTRTFGGSSAAQGFSVHQTSDKGYVVAGYVTAGIGPGGYDAYLIKTDSTGATQWTRAWGGNSYDEARAVWQTSGGDYIVAGYTASSGAGGTDVYLNFREDPGYVCGDADSSGAVAVADVVYLTNYLNHGGPAPKPIGAGDADCSGTVDSGDITYLNNYLYSSGPEPCCP
jgi:hypothetical protein